MTELILVNEEATKHFAYHLADNLVPGSIVTFSGDLGAGKTFICREIIKKLCGKSTIVPSPTFNIMLQYHAPNFTIYHFDLYRLINMYEIYELGIEDAWKQHVCLIEWPQIIEHIIPKPYTHIHISLNHHSNRICSIYNFSNN